MAPTAEDRLTEWLRRVAPGGEAIGDDVAALGTLADAVVTVDQQIAGTHFPPGLDPVLVARRLLEVNLSDIAAAGARPTHALLSMAAPVTFDHRRFLNALADACRRRRVLLVGGDTARSEGVNLSLTLLGTRPPRGRLLRRDAARPGDRLWLGGTVGQAALGRRLIELGARITGRRVELPKRFQAPASLRKTAASAVRRQFQPRAQIELGFWLGRRSRAAAIDISDGLALDLTRLCTASEVGAEIDGTALPLAAGFHRLADALDLPPEACAFGGGEDYVLLFALPPRVRPPAALGSSAIGRLVTGREIVVVQAGQPTPLAPLGWSHL